MITMTFTIEEIAEGKVKVHAHGEGDATPFEVELALAIRGAVNATVEKRGRQRDIHSFTSVMRAPEITDIPEKGE